MEVNHGPKLSVTLFSKSISSKKLIADCMHGLISFGMVTTA
jgi:hypothetical protein